MRGQRVRILETTLEFCLPWVPEISTELGWIQPPEYTWDHLGMVNLNDNHFSVWIGSHSNPNHFHFTISSKVDHGCSGTELQDCALSSCFGNGHVFCSIWALVKMVFTMALLSRIETKMLYHITILGIEETQRAWLPERPEQAFVQYISSQSRLIMICYSKGCMPSLSIIGFLTSVCVQLLSHVWLCATPWTVACQAPLSMEFFQARILELVAFPTPGDLPDPGMKPAPPVSSALAGGFFTTAPPGKPLLTSTLHMWDFSGGLVVKTLPASAGDAGDVGLTPGSGRSLEEEMATHSSIFAWTDPDKDLILWTKEPGGLQSMGSQRFRHDWVAAHAHVPYIYRGYAAGICWTK